MHIPWLLALAATVGLVACGDDVIYPFEGLTRVSGATPFADDCNGQSQVGEVFDGAEIEPRLAVDPTDPLHFIGVWQQDRWSNGGANGLVTAWSNDGGETWARTAVPFSRCGRADAASTGDYERASDPWVTFTADGIAFQIALAFDTARGPRNAILASRSGDGGRSWEPPIELIADDNPDVFNDKESITADPKDPRRVYAVWDRVTGLTRRPNPLGTGPAWFARTDAAIWEPAKIIFDPGPDAQTIGNQIVVLPDGMLINAFTLIRNSSSTTPTAEAAVIRSRDQGASWSAPISISPMKAVTVADARTMNQVAIRSGTIIADVAVDPRSGVLYLAWEDASFTNGHNGIVMTTSLDAGLTWSAPQLVNGDPRSHAFTPSLAVATDGTLAMSYYDLRGSVMDELMVTTWLATSLDRGATWSEEALAGPFDLRSTRFGRSYFLGDYQGLVASGTTFVPFFSAALARATPSAIFTRPVRAESRNARATYAAVAASSRASGGDHQPDAALRSLLESRPFVFEGEAKAKGEAEAETGGVCDGEEHLGEVVCTLAPE
jgi:hypothetical protein